MAGGFWGPSRKEVVFPHPGAAAWPLCFCHSGLAESRCLEQWVSEGQTCSNVVKKTLQLGLCVPPPPHTTQQTCFGCSLHLQVCPSFSWATPNPLLHTWGFISLGEGGMVVVSFLEILKEARGEERRGIFK